MTLVVHYWAHLQSGHGLRYYGNMTRTRNVSEYMLVLARVHACTRSMPSYIYFAGNRHEAIIN